MKIRAPPSWKLFTQGERLEEINNKSSCKAQTRKTDGGKEREVFCIYLMRVVFPESTSHVKVSCICQFLSGIVESEQIEHSSQGNINTASKNQILFIKNMYGTLPADKGITSPLMDSDSLIYDLKMSFYMRPGKCGVSPQETACGVLTRGA